MTFGDQDSPVEILISACESTRSILENVTRDQLALHTPCEDWPVHDLIDHIVSATRFFADIAGAEPAAEGEEWPSYADADFVTAFGQHSRRVIAAFSAPAAMERIMALPTGPAPGSPVSRLRLERSSSTAGISPKPPASPCLPVPE